MLIFHKSHIDHIEDLQIEDVIQLKNMIKHEKNPNNKHRTIKIAKLYLFFIL